MNQSLFEQLETLDKQSKGLPPVHLWNPERVYDIDIRIDKDGRWFHEGNEIKRKSLAKLFASILKREGEHYYLVTPVEKARIRVEDVPFVIVEIEVEQEKNAILFRSSVDDVIKLSTEHPVTLRQSALSAQVLPYIEVRNNLLARFNRSVYYQAVELAKPEGDGLFLYSAGQRFCIGHLK